MEKKYLGFAVGNGFLLFVIFWILGNMLTPFLQGNQNIGLVVGLIIIPAVTMLIEFLALKFSRKKMPLYFYAISYVVFFILIIIMTINSIRTIPL